MRRERVFFFAVKERNEKRRENHFPPEKRREPSKANKQKKLWRLPLLLRASRCACAPAYAAVSCSSTHVPSPPLLRQSVERPRRRQQGHAQGHRRRRRRRILPPRPPMAPPPRLRSRTTAPPPPPPPAAVTVARLPTSSWGPQASARGPTRRESPTRWGRSTSARGTSSGPRSKRAASSASR